MAVDIGTLRGLLVLDDKFSAKLDIASSKLDATGKKWTQIGGQLNAVGSQLTKTVTLPLLLIGGAAIKAASDFESSFAGVEKTVTATEPQLQKLAQGFRDMAKEIPVNVNEINRIGEAAGQLGIKTENILDFTRVMADLGVATNLSADQAATSLARLANITGLPQTQFDRLGASIVLLGNNLETTESEIVDFGLNIAGAGKLAGLTEGQILGIGAAMSSVGIESQAGGTAVQKVLIAMTQAAAEGGEKLDVFARTAGLSAQEFATAFEEDAGGAFTRFVEGLGVQGKMAFGTLEDLDLQDQRLIKSFLSLAGAGDKLRDAIALGTRGFDENRALVEEVAKRYETFASQLTIFKNNAQDVFITLGTALLPILQDLLEIATPLIQKLGEAATFFSNLPKPVRATALAILAMVAAVGPLLIISGSLISAFGSVASLLAKGLGFKAVGLAAQGAQKGMNVLANTVLPNFLTKSVQSRNALGQFTKATKVFSLSLLGSGGITGALGTVVTFLTGPVGIAVAIGVALLAWKPFRDVIFAIGGFLFTLARGALQLVIGGLKMLASVLSPVIDFVGAVARAIIGPLGDALVAAAAWISDLNEGLNELITNEAGLAFEDATAKAQGLADTTQVLTDVFRKFGQEGLETWLKNADRTVVSIDDLKAGLGVLESQGKLTEQEFDALRTALLEAETAATAAGDALADPLATGAGAAERANAKLVEVLDSLGVVTKEAALAGIQNLTTALNSGLVPPEQMIALIDELATQYEDLGLRGIPEVEAALQRLNSRYETTNGILDTAISKTNRLNQMVEDGPPFIDDLDLALKDVGGTADEFAKSLTDVTPPFRAVGDIFNDMGIVVPDVSADLDNLTRAVMSGDAPVRQLVEGIRAQRDEYERLGVLTPDVAKKLNELEREALKNATAADRAAVGFKGLFDGFEIGIPKIDNAVKQFSGVVDIVSKIGTELGGLGEKFGEFGAKIKGFMEGAGGQAAIAFGGAFAQAIQSGDSGIEAGIKGALSAGLNFIPVVGPLISQLAGPIVDLFQGLFGGPSAAEKEGRSVAAAFRDAIRSELSAKGLGEVKLQFPNQVQNAAFLSSIVEKLIASGVAAEAAGAQARQWGTQLFEAEKKGGAAVQGVIDQINAATGASIDAAKSSQEIGAAFDEAFQSATTAAENFSLAGSKAVRRIISESREAGVSIASVSQFIEKQVSSIAAGTQKALAAGIETGAQARLAATGLRVAFAEMIKDGRPVTEVIALIGDKAKELRDRFIELGLEPSASLNKLTQLTNLLANEAIANAIDRTTGLGEVFKGVAALGLATQQDLNAFGNAAKEAFDEVIAGGATGAQAIALMGPQLQILFDAQQNFGFEVDAGTQKLLDQALAQDVVKVAALNTTDAITTGFDGLFERFDAFLEAQGVATDGFFQFGDSAENALATVDSSVDTTAQNLETKITAASISSSTAVKGMVDTAKADLGTLGVKATEAADTISTTMSGGIRFIEGELMAMSNTGASAFSGISDAADMAAGRAEDRFDQMRMRLTGASIIPDMVNEAHDQILTIGDAAEEAAHTAELAFANASMTSGLEAQAGHGHRGGRGGRGFIGDPDEQRHGRFEGFGGQSRSRPRFTDGGRSSGGGTGRNVDIIQLVVDGVVLTEIVLRNTPRVLANKGLGHG